MKIEANTSKSLKFQEQLIPPYLNSGLDFYWKADFLSTSENFEFGLKSVNGQKTSYKFKSGLVYDYYDRMVGAYRNGGISIEYGLQSGLPGLSGYNAYQFINSRPISLNDFYSGYNSAPFDKFYVENSGSSPVEFDLTLRGFAPPTLYSNLKFIGGATYSGNIQQSGWLENPTQGVKYGLFNISLPVANGKVLSFETEKTGILHYSISGNSLPDGGSVPIEFDSYFGKVTRTIQVVGNQENENVGGETGISLSLFGESNLLPANGQLDFSVDYFSNAENEVVVELTSSSSFSSPILSGSGAGSLLFSGNIIKSGLIYSAPFITGVADLEASENSSFNTQYNVFDRYIEIKQRVSSRTSGVFYTGVNQFTFTGVPMYGVYNGPYPQFIGLYFSGLGDVTVSHDFEEFDEGVYTFNEEHIGFLNSGYQASFSLASTISKLGTSDKIVYPATLTTFPTGQAFGFINSTVTGRGIVTKSVPYSSFFGEGTGRVYTGRISVEGEGTGNILFSGNAYEWYNYNSTLSPSLPGVDPGELFGAYSFLNASEGEGLLTNGVSTFRGTGLPNPLYQTWGYPTGPSKIVIQPQTAVIYENLEIPFITGYYLGSVGLVPTGFGYTGRAVGYVSYGGGTFDGPIFPPPGDTGLYPYYGDNNLLTVKGNAYYGRGMIYSSGGTDNGTDQFGIFIKGESSTPAYFDIVSGNLRAVYEGPVTEFAVPISYIFPAKLVDVTEGEDFLSYDRASLEFDNPLIEKIETGIISGAGFVPVSNLNLKYNLFYSETPDSFPENGYKEEGWFTPVKFERPTPYNYPVGAKKAYIRVKSDSSDLESFDVLSLKVSAANNTGEVVITTNTTI
jgi:hypothetical protein